MASELSSQDPRGLQSWLKIAEDAQIIYTPSPKSVQCSKPITEVGVSLGFLKRFMDSLEGFLEERDTYGLVSKLICMITARPPGNKKGRFYDYIPPRYTGQPMYYVVHPWSNAWQDTIEQLISTLTDADDEYLTPTEVNKQLDSTFVWIDWVACNQFRRTPTATAKELNVRELVKACSKGAALVFDSDLKFMTRTWCLYETWCFAYYGDITKLHICLPADTSVPKVVALEKQIDRIELGRSESKEPKETSRILSEVKSCVGMKLFCKVLKDVLTLQLRSRLRWSQYLEELAVYCGAMLHIGEYGHLQHVLHGIAELHDDSGMLEEVKDIYRLYDTEGKGVLEEAHFVEVLGLAGFEKEEASQVFNEVHKEFEDGATIAEFESWWMLSQRQNEARYRRPVVMTSKAFEENLIRMQSYLQRMGLHELAEHYTLYIAKIKHGNLNHGEAELSPAALKGEWQAMADLCAWKLHVGDFKAASKIVYEALLANADQVDQDPRTLRVWDTLKESAEICETLSLYLKLFNTMLKHHQGQGGHCDLFRRFAFELSDPATIAAVASTKGVPPSKQAPLESLSQQQLEFSKFSVVRDMIALKYGAGKPLERGLIVEAEKSLGVWMAANKTRGKVETANEAANMKEMAVSYLVAYNAPNDDPSLINTNPKTSLSSIMGGVKLEHDIPEYGPYTSCLASLGSDAQAWLAEFQAQHDEERSQLMSEPSQLAKEALAALNPKHVTQVVWKPPSFSLALRADPMLGEGALGKVMVSRLSPKAGQHSYSDLTDDAAPLSSGTTDVDSLVLKAYLLDDPAEAERAPPPRTPQPPNQRKPLDDPVEAERASCPAFGRRGNQLLDATTPSAPSSQGGVHPLLPEGGDHSSQGGVHHGETGHSLGAKGSNLLGGTPLIDGTIPTSPGNWTTDSKSAFDQSCATERLSCPGPHEPPTHISIDPSTSERSSCPTMRRRNPFRDVGTPRGNGGDPTSPTGLSAPRLSPPPSGQGVSGAHPPAPPSRIKGYGDRPSPFRGSTLGGVSPKSGVGAGTGARSGGEGGLSVPCMDHLGGSADLHTYVATVHAKLGPRRPPVLVAPGVRKPRRASMDSGPAEPLSPQPPSAPRDSGEEVPNNFHSSALYLASLQGQKESQARLPRTSDSHALAHRKVFLRSPPIPNSESSPLSSHKSLEPASITAMATDNPLGRRRSVDPTSHPHPHLLIHHHNSYHTASDHTMPQRPKVEAPVPRQRTTEGPARRSASEFGAMMGGAMMMRRKSVTAEVLPPESDAVSVTKLPPLGPYGHNGILLAPYQLKEYKE